MCYLSRLDMDGLLNVLKVLCCCSVFVTVVKVGSRLADVGDEVFLWNIVVIKPNKYKRMHPHKHKHKHASESLNTDGTCSGCA